MPQRAFAGVVDVDHNKPVLGDCHRGIIGRAGNVNARLRQHVERHRFGRLGASTINVELAPDSFELAASAWQVHDLREAIEVFERCPQRLSELLACARPQAAVELPDWQGELLRTMAESEHDIAVLARQLGVSAEHASRTLSRSYGMSPRALRREVRWRRALELLGGTMPLAEVAAAAGFADQSHLHRVVVAHAGCTPALLRRQIKYAQDRHLAVAA